MYTPAKSAEIKKEVAKAAGEKKPTVITIMETLTKMGLAGDAVNIKYNPTDRSWTSTAEKTVLYHQ